MRPGALRSRVMAACVLPVALQAQKPLTLQQILSAPYASELAAAPVGHLFAWVEDEEGRRNLWVGGPGQAARMLTHNAADDGQEIRHLAWSPDGDAIAYTYGAESGADGKPANPAHLQSALPLTVMVQPLAPDAKPIVVGAGHDALFLRGGCGVLFVQAGKIWYRGLKDEPQPMSQSTTGDQKRGLTEGALDLPECDRGGGPAQLVYDRGSASSLRLSPDGNTLAFISRRPEANQPAHSFLALYDLRTRVLSFPAPSTGNDMSPVFSPDGRQLAWLRAPFTQVREFALDRVSANPWSIHVMDRQTHAVRTVFAPEANKPGSALPKMATGEPPLLFPAANRVIFASEADGWVHLYALDPAGPNRPTLLTPADAEVEDPVLRGETLVFASNRARVSGAVPLLAVKDMDRRHLWRIDLTQAEAYAQPLTWGAGIEVHPQMAADGTIAALASTGSQPMAPAWVRDGGQLEPLWPVSAPHRSAIALEAPQQVLFSASDGVALHGQLFLPGGTAGSSASLRKQIGSDNEIGSDKQESPGSEQAGIVRHPAILFFHGGPRRQMLLGYPSGEYYSNAYAMNQYLALRGFLVLSVNYRCGIGYGLKFRQCERAGADGASEYADVLAAQRYLASRPDVDVHRIGVWGGSYGGYLTALALARNSNLFAAGVDLHGVHDWNLEDNASDWKQGTFAEQDAIAAKAFASSPMAAIRRWRSPVLLIHGDNDPEVAYAETAILADKLRAQQTPVEELILPDEVHGFLLHSDWLKAYAAAAAFFERTLKP